MKHVHDIYSRVTLWLTWLAGGFIIFGCAVPISIDVISRAITGSTLVESFEISGYALAASIGLGMGGTVTTKANIRVDILISKLPKNLRMGIDLIASLAISITALALAYFAFDVLYDSWRLDARSESTLRVPLIVPQSIWWVGLFWFATVSTLTPVFAISRLMVGDHTAFLKALSNSDLPEELQEAGFPPVTEKT